MGASTAIARETESEMQAMSRMQDIETIKARLSIRKVVEEKARLKLVSAGRHDWRACCPFHKEDTPSFFVSEDKQVFFCHGCGRGGGVLDFIALIENRSVADVIHDLAANEEIASRPALRVVKSERDDTPGFRVVMPVPENAPSLMASRDWTVQVWNPKQEGQEGARSRKRYNPSKVWDYRDGDGRLLGHVIRLDIQEGRKTTKIPMTVVWVRRPDGGEEWAVNQFGLPKPLFGLAELARARANGIRIVLVGEGEKTAENLATLGRQNAWPSVTWPNGTSNVDKADWTPLAGMQVVLVPDADPQGLQAMKAIFAILLSIGCTVFVLPPPPDAPQGWDWADPIPEEAPAAWDWGGRLRSPTPDDFARFLSSNLKDALEYFGDPREENLDAAIDHAERVQASHLPSDAGGLIAAIRADRESALLPENLRLASRFMANSPADWVRIKMAAAEAGLPRRDYEKAVRAAGQESGPPKKERPPSPFQGSGGPAPQAEKEAGPIMPLGYYNVDGGITYYYFSALCSAIVALNPQMHTAKHLMQLASLEWWRTQFPTDKGGTDWDLATDTLMQACYRRGVYDPSRLRGRGAWVDGDTIILHLGDRLLVDGEELDLAQYHGRYLYEAGLPLPTPDLADPLTSDEASQVIAACQLVRWPGVLADESRGHLPARLLAGFIVTAQVCGAFDWRSHVWLTGESTSGKTFTLKRIISALLGATALYFQSATTEAGIRRIIKSDALPVVFEEAEANDERGRVRMQQVLELMRQSSSEQEGCIAKGRTDGKAGSQSYHIRSMFLLASVVVSLREQADQSRVTVLELASPPRKGSPERKRDRERFDVLQRIVETFTPEFARRLFARSVALMHVLRHNAKVLADAGGEIFGSQRIGDQYGTLLAGAFSLESEERLTYEGARAWIESLDWRDHETDDIQTDQDALLQRLCTTKLHADMGHNAAGKERSIGELLAIAAGREADSSILPEHADKFLRRHGIRHDGGGVWISNTHPEIARILKDTPFALNWKRFLKRLHPDQPVSAKVPIYYAPGVSHRSTYLPYAIVFPGGSHAAPLETDMLI